MPRRDSDYVRALKGKKPRFSGQDQVKFPITKAAREAPPDYLDEFALAHWKRMTKILDDAKLYQAPSRDKLARYCQTLADYETIQEMRKKMGRFAKHKVTQSNWRQKVYENNSLREYESVLSNFEKEYGLTPASAARIRHPAAALVPAEKLVAFIDEKPQLEA